MNQEATKLIRKRQEEAIALGGDEAYRQHALQHLKLKTVVKESHATTVHALCFNHTSPECANIFATVGADQATVYDDSHMGDYIGVVVHFSNQKTEHTEGGELQTACWMSSKGWTPHPHGDACLAVSGADSTISIISVVEAAVVKLLRGHTKDVVDLAATPAHPTLLASLSRDGNLRLWDVEKEVCLSSIATTDSTCIALSSEGNTIALGTSRGRIMQYTVARDPGSGAFSIADGSKEEFKVQSGSSSHSEAVDCLQYLPGNRLATKSSDGRMFVWNVGTGKSLTSWKVPGCNGLGGFSTRCQFSSTADGKYISVGNASGDCYVYNSENGKREAHMSAIKVSAPVRACALSEDCRHLVAAVGKGFLFRFEYLSSREKKKGDDDEEEEENGNQVDAAAAVVVNGGTEGEGEDVAAMES